MLFTAVELKMISETTNDELEKFEVLLYFFMIKPQQYNKTTITIQQ